MTDLNRRNPICHLTDRPSKPSISRVVRSVEFPLKAAETPAGEIPLPSNVGGNYDTDWARRYLSRLTRRLALASLGKAVIAYYANPTIRGLDRLHDLEGPAIFAANHQSHADTLLMLTSMPAPWKHKAFVGAAADYFFGNKSTAAISALFIGAIPIERTSINRNTIEKAVDLLRGGWSMVIYPEGGRSPDGWGQEFRPGAAFLAKQADVPVVPVHIRGTFDILRKGRNWPKKSTSTVNFGRPLEFADDDNNRSFTKRLQTSVEALADETATGNWYASRQRAHSESNPGIQGPDGSPWRRRWALTDIEDKTDSRRRWPYV